MIRLDIERVKIYYSALLFRMNRLVAEEPQPKRRWIEMLKLRGCPKCQGALYLAADMYGRYVNCLQCGFSRDLPDTPAEQKPAESPAPEFQAPERKAA